MRIMAFNHTNSRTLTRAVIQSLFLAFVAITTTALIYVGIAYATGLSIANGEWQRINPQIGILGAFIAGSFVIYAGAIVARYFGSRAHARGRNMILAYALPVLWASMLTSAVTHAYLDSDPTAASVIAAILIALAVVPIKRRQAASS